MEASTTRLSVVIEECRKRFLMERDLALNQSVNFRDVEYQYLIARLGLGLVHSDSFLDNKDINALKNILKRNTENLNLDERNVDLKFRLQKICFALSVLYGYDKTGIVTQPILAHLTKPAQIYGLLELYGVSKNSPGSGNLSMFVGVLAYHQLQQTGDGRYLREWLEYHKQLRNSLGLWGSGPLYLQVQNGYHQYELISYLGLANVPPQLSTHIEAVLSAHGCFSPFPGGDSCFDYDAIFFLNPVSLSNKSLLNSLRNNLMGMYLGSGRFSENRLVRPRLTFLKNVVRHQLLRFPTLAERLCHLKWSLALMAPKHSSRRNQFNNFVRYTWYEGDLWSAYFRLLAIARLTNYIDPNNQFGFKFARFPGVGSSAFTIK
jgi:hypothetical protein